MGRFLLLSSAVILLGALSLLDDPNPTRAPDARPLGGICEGTRECRLGTRCIDSDGVLAGQCSASCAANSACQQAFGLDTMCLGADLCARACDKPSDCPSGTICNDYGWCERPQD